MYIVVFNVGSRDVEVMTNSHGFLETFYDVDTAKQYAEEWIDGDQFRSYKIYKQEK